jgi:hypothetical protein
MKLIWVCSIGYGREDTSPNKFYVEPRFTEPYMVLCTLHHRNLSHLNDKKDLYVLLFRTRLKAH